MAKRRAVKLPATYCAGPKRARGATQDPALGCLPGPLPEGYLPGGELPWLNVLRRPVLEFCAHGRQYAHPVEVSS
jgi:hypothetical protein